MTPQALVLLVAGFLVLLISLAGFAERRFGRDRDLDEPWDPYDREPPCLCGVRVPASRHRYHESSRWQERTGR